MDSALPSLGARTVGSVMCETGRPPYRQLSARPPPPLPRRRAPRASASAAAARRVEADETAKSLHSFDETLRRGGSRAAEKPLAAAPHSLARLQSRLFSAAVLEQNTIVARLREMGCAAVLERMRSVGARLGMRAVTMWELCFLLGSVLDEPALRVDEVAYLFRFFDWTGTGEMNFNGLLASAGLLFCPVEMISAVFCKRLLKERQLDDSVIPISDVHVILAALETLFLAEVPVIPNICAAVRHAVEDLLPNHTVPVAVFCTELRRFPKLLQCISWIQWDGTIVWPPLCVDGIFFSRPHSKGEALDYRLLRNECISSGGGITLAKMMSDRNARNVEILSVAVNSGRNVGVFQAAEGADGEKEEFKVSELDICHPRFVADAHCVSATDV